MKRKGKIKENKRRKKKKNTNTWDKGNKTKRTLSGVGES